MTEQEIMDWINSLPGKTFQQKLNLAQDLAEAYNIDLFGANESFVSESYMPQPNMVEMVWGKDPVLGPIFTAIDQGMSPAQAVQAARENKELAGYFPRVGEKGDVNYLQIGADYLTEKLQNQFAEQQFQMNQANKQAIYEGKQPLSMPGGTQSMYDVLGRPSLAELENMYSSGMEQFRDQGFTDLSEFAPTGTAPEVRADGRRSGFKIGPNGVRVSIPKPELPDVPDLTFGNVARGAVMAAGGIIPKVASVVAPKVVGGIRNLVLGEKEKPVTVDRTGGESPDEIRMRKEYARSRIGAETAKKKMGTSGFAPDPAHEEWKRNLIRELAYRSIAGMGSTPVGQTDRDLQAAERLMALRRYSNVG